MSNEPRFLVVDGYTKPARDELAAAGATVAGALYAAMLEQVSPGSACDILYPCDAGAQLPGGAALDGYDGVAWTGCSLTVFDDIPEVRAKAIRILARVPTIVAGFDRLRRGLDLVTPDQSHTFAANFLYLLNAEKPTQTMERAFDACMILHADHGLNASTFTCRVITSTLSDIYSAITGAIGALRGPLHGGANEGVMHMLNEIASVDEAEQFVMNKLAAKDRIMGFGHRVYKSYDPRATFLKTLAEQLANDTGNGDLYAKSSAIEKTMEREVASKGIYPNVDFYSATTYHSIGLKLDLFTPMFALSRISGWAGHALEQLDGNRLIRPKADYIGPHEKPYVAIEQR